MNGNYDAIALEGIATSKATTRVLRSLSVILAAVALPAAVVLFTPLVGWVLLTAIICSPLILFYVLYLAARQAEAERRRARA
jgi:uncharacterized membrane protein